MADPINTPNTTTIHNHPGYAAPVQPRSGVPGFALLLGGAVVAVGIAALVLTRDAADTPAATPAGDTTITIENPPASAPVSDPVPATPPATPDTPPVVDPQPMPPADPVVEPPVATPDAPVAAD